MKVSQEAETQYYAENMKRETILQRLRDKGCRITKQREVLIDVILQGSCNCCKEIYYLALKKNPHIGMATIYRMMNLLEEVGALRWRSEYEICTEELAVTGDCIVELDDSTSIALHSDALKGMIEEAMEQQGMLMGKRIRDIRIKNN